MWSLTGPLGQPFIHITKTVNTTSLGIFVGKSPGVWLVKVC